MRKIVVENKEEITLINKKSNEVCHVKVINDTLYVEDTKFPKIMNLAIQEKLLKNDATINNESLDTYIEKFINVYQSKKY